VGETKCTTALVTKTRQVQDLECAVVSEKQCTTLWEAKFDRQCRTKYEQR